MSNEVEQQQRRPFARVASMFFCAIALVSIAALCARLRAQPVPRNAMIYLGMEHPASPNRRGASCAPVEGGGYSEHGTASCLPLLAQWLRRSISRLSVSGRLHVIVIRYVIDFIPYDIGIAGGAARKRRCAARIIARYTLTPPLCVLHQQATRPDTNQVCDGVRNTRPCGYAPLSFAIEITRVVCHCQPKPKRTQRDSVGIKLARCCCVADAAYSRRRSLPGGNRGSCRFTHAEFGTISAPLSGRRGLCPFSASAALICFYWTPVESGGAIAPLVTPGRAAVGCAARAESVPTSHQSGDT